MQHSVSPDLSALPRASSCWGGCKVHNSHCCICNSGISLYYYCSIVSGFSGLWALSRPAIGRNRRRKGAQKLNLIGWKSCADWLAYSNSAEARLWLRLSLKIGAGFISRLKKNAKNLGKINTTNQQPKKILRMELGAHRIPSTCDSGYLLRVYLHVISNMVLSQGAQLEKVQEKAIAMSPFLGKNGL